MLWLEPAPGHTPGAVCLNIAPGSGGGAAVLCGDLMHHAIQVPEPQMSSIFYSNMHPSAPLVMRPADSPGK